MLMFMQDKKYLLNIKSKYQQLEMLSLYETFVTIKDNLLHKATKRD